MTFSNVPQEVLQAYGDRGALLTLDRINMGLINKTYLVTTTREKFVLQEVSPIFDTTIIEDSQAVTNHLSRIGINGPTILPTIDDKLFLTVNGRVFRALKFIAGQCFNTIQSLKMAESAGRVVGQFHAALLDFDYSYRSKRRHGGDYRFHQENLIEALKAHQAHDYFPRVSDLANKMLACLDGLTAGLTTTVRNAHGDPKISNIIFDEKEEAICLVDFDTLGKTGWSLEIGDALRSWCNPNPEDVLDSFVDMHIAENSLKGYGSVMRGHFSECEAKELVTHAQAITLCLATRYLADVLNEKYWAYDRDRFLRPAEHNWLRAQAMFGLFNDFFDKKARIFEMVRDLLF